MKTKAFHYVCAYPALISWAMGAMAIDAFVLYSVTDRFSCVSVLRNPMVLLLLVLALIPSTLLGFVPVMFTYPLVNALCVRFNGGPFRVGDEVLILSGVHRGTITHVYETTVGQGGATLLRLDMGPEAKEKHGDLFEQCDVLRCQKATD